MGRVDWSELTRADAIELAVYGTLALYVALALPRLFRGNLARAFGAVVFWLAAFFAAIAGYSYRFELGRVAERVMAVLVPGTAIDTAPGEVTVIRRPDGQFVVNASVGAVRVPFVVDTGASAVVLRAEDALKLKIPLGRLVYDVEVATANGRTLAASIELPSLSVGALTQRGVKALVARPGALHENLLGMSYLGELASFTVADDKLTLRGR